MNSYCRRAAAALLAILILLALLPEEVSAKPLLSYGMLPVYAQDIKDGVYDVEMASDSAFFNMQSGKLTVKDGEMTLQFTIPSLSYLYVYEGERKDAKAAGESAWISREEDGDSSIFTIPAEALNKEIPCAAYSKRRKKWYGRNIVIYASSLPEDALLIELPDYDLIEKAIDHYVEDGLAEKPDTADEAEEETEDVTEGAEAVSTDEPDGVYSIECNMTGGSGRASVSSPTILNVRDGRAYVELLWSSPYYDYMIVGGKRYLNKTTDGGNSTFEIPVLAMDEGFSVIADTTAMGDPVEIEYVLTFYEDSIGEKGLVPQEAAKKVLVIALIVIVAGGILNFFVKRQRR